MYTTNFPKMAYAFVFPIRVVQGIFAIIVLGLMAYGKHALPEELFTN